MKNKSFANKVLDNLGKQPLSESEKEEAASAIRRVLQRLKDGKISIERAEALIKKINSAFSDEEPSKKKPAYRPDTSSCSSPSRNC